MSIDNIPVFEDKITVWDNWIDSPIAERAELVLAYGFTHMVYVVGKDEDYLFCTYNAYNAVIRDEELKVSHGDPVEFVLSDIVNYKDINL